MFAIREGRDKVIVSDFMDAVEKIVGSEKDEEFIKEAGVMFG
jgi:proteasome regulatory subunit